ncbi:MAG: preprotein translocase subunit SecE [Phycisphaerales bacterium]|nr:preprotein translocase subunit SecE [Phycisphaerales bacterium]
MAAFGIYKKGQGKFVRLGTVVGIGLLVLLGIQWVDHSIVYPWPSYAKAILSLVLAVLGGLLAYWAVNNRRFADFMILTESEMRKVAWPAARTVVNATKLVIMMVLGLALMLWVVDGGFVWLFKYIHVLS